MDPAELTMPIIGLECTILAIFFVSVSTNLIWGIIAFVLVFIGILCTIGWAIMRNGTNKR